MDIKMPLDVSCEELLKAICTYCGWLRKERKMKILSPGRRYCVLSDRCFYYFKHEQSKKPEGKFPLYGFNTVKRTLDKPLEWSFVLEHVQPNQKNYVFAASSQQEMVEWMKHIKEEMLRANNRGQRTTADGSSDGSSNYKPDSLEQIEEKIYDDFTPYQHHHIPSQISSDSDSDDTECDKQVMKTQTELSQLRIPVLPTTKKDMGKALTDKAEITRFKLPKRVPAEGQSNPRRHGYEHVDKIAGHPEYLEIQKIPTNNNYYESIYYIGDKEEATSIIENIAKDGVFLVRNSDSAEVAKVLVVYSQKDRKAKKFRIFTKEEDSKIMYFMKTELQFETVEELIYHYYHNSISTDEVFKLTEPYLLVNSH